MLIEITREMQQFIKKVIIGASIFWIVALFANFISMAIIYFGVKVF